MILLFDKKILFRRFSFQFSKTKRRRVPCFCSLHPHVLSHRDAFGTANRVFSPYSVYSRDCDRLVRGVST